MELRRHASILTNSPQGSSATPAALRPSNPQGVCPGCGAGQTPSADSARDDRIRFRHGTVTGLEDSGHGSVRPLRFERGKQAQDR